MNEKALHVLEFNKIIEKLKYYAASTMGKATCDSISPLNDINSIEFLLDETDAAAAMVVKKGSIPLGGLTDISPQLKRAQMGGVLNPGELLNIGRFLYVSEKAMAYGRHETPDEAKTVLDGLFEVIQGAPQLQREIENCILSDTEIADGASRELRDIRREIRQANDKIKDSLNAVINSAAYRNMLQDHVITMRGNRYCVPVKMEYKNSFPGMVHDQSNSGSTLFIEPAAVVNLNNRIRELEGRERAEIERILAALSDMAANHSVVLLSNLESLSKLDFIFARAQLAISMDASRPVLNTKGRINIKKGRHPLLNKETVVPTDIYLGDKFTALLITGPNTGGKTVALKTLGLFQLMGQSGLFIPAFEGSELGV
ncbi:MAG: endonuclease MutS2, partial [Firmicutes bacterium]|nr:endonuclease MutS2 [Bacillota bacterium]